MQDIDTRTDEELAQAGITVTRDEHGKRHIRMVADPFVLNLKGALMMKCCQNGCGAEAVLTDPPNESAKGWQIHPQLGQRCPRHPWTETLG